MQHINEKKTKTEDVKFYSPTYQDYKFWTEEKNIKKTFLEKSFSIKKYYSHNFFKNDNIGYFLNNGIDLFIFNRNGNEKLIQENFNASMPKKMLFFKDPFFYREKIKYFDVKTPITEIFYISLIQKISFFQEKERSFFLKTYMEYEKYSQDHLFHYPYNKFYILRNFEKKINHFYLRNGLFLIFNQKKINIKVGSIFDRIHYQLFNNNNYKNKDINSLSIQTEISYPINNIFEFNSNGKWIIENNNKSYVKANIMLNTFLFSKYRFLTRFSINENDNGIYNSFIPFHVLRKNQDCYNNEQKDMFFFGRGKEKTMDFSLSSDEDEKHYVSFYISRLSFQDQEKKIKKFLYWKYIQLYGFKIKTIYDIWKFQFNHILLYHKCNSDPLIFSIPNFLSRTTILYKDNYFHKALFIQTGFSFHYFSKFFYQKIYYPFHFQTFSFEKECIPNRIVGGTPFVDYFFNFKIYRTTFYFSIQNIGFYDIYNSHNIFIKTGFLWNLFT